MKRHTLLAFILFVSLAAMAQSISVKSFRALPTDMTASSLEGKRIDQNGNVAALIKVVTNETGFVFEGGTLGIVDTKQQVSEIWVWLPKASRKITIKHPQLGQLRDYLFPVEIESERTYEIVLTTAKIETIVKEEVHEQFLTFEITPHEAVLEVNDQQWTVSASGSASKLVNFGTYSYRVQAPNYHPDAGRITVNDPDNTTKVTINLKPNFGWIEVPGNGLLQGATVYVDNALIGKAPCKSEALKSGQHSIRIIKELYEPYTTMVTVSDNETTTIHPSLTADFAHVTLQVDADAEIWVNNERKGTRSWSGDLPTGVYRIECKLTNHETTTTTKDVTNRMNGEVIQLEAPKPIFGSLMVESEPASATIFIDGKAVGETPKLIKELLIGQHNIRLTKPNHADYTETVTIAKGERKQVQATLSNGKEVRFSCNVTSAILEIDGQQMSAANGSYLLTYGSHRLKATAEDYLDYTATLTVTESTHNHDIAMQPIRKDEQTFTVNGVSFTMRLVEGGTFQMGATSEQGNDAYDNEKPVHKVSLKSYYIGETEVTQALWKAVMGSNPSYFKGDNLPVENVSWNECQEFIRKLNQKTGKNFRLPTEAEWEYAARGGKKSKGYKYAGSNTLRDVAWFGQCNGNTYDNGNSGEKTHPVKGKAANELGLYDMSGNVWEWCQDWYGDYSSGSLSNPTGPSTGKSRVLRGGCWINFAMYCRVSFRHFNLPDNRGSYFGFRLALPQ